MPIQVSILDILLTSEQHREALLKILSDTQMHKDILVEKIFHIVENVLASNHITFLR